MIAYEKVKTIFFDYDGTIHNSIKIYAPAFKKAYHYLIQKGFAKGREWTEKEISYWLGFNSVNMWREFMPELSEEMRKKSSKIIGSELNNLAKEKKAVLYEGASEILEYLKCSGYNLIFISNCGKYYMDTHNEVFKLDRYFDEMVCAEEYNFIPKYEILNRIMEKYSHDMVIIGDRKQDVQAGKINNIHTIGCGYGFAFDGELESADLVINDIRELKKYF